MTKPETTSGDGRLLSADPAQAVDLAAEMTGFLSDFGAFQADIKSRLKQQEDRMTQHLDRKSISRARPALSNAVEQAAPHQKAFNDYLRSGDDDALRGLELEGKALSTAIAADGGYLVDPQTSETIKGTCPPVEG